MKKTSYIIVVIAILSSCADKTSIIGSWIEQDNFINPAIYEIGPDYFKILNEPISGKRIYKVKNDTFIFEQFFEIKKVRFTVENDKLTFYSVNDDSILIKLERNVFRNFIDFFNVKKNTSIMLPIVAEAKRIRWSDWVNALVYDSEDTGSIYFNGEKYKLDSLTYLKLLPRVNDHMYGTDNSLIFCDSRIKLNELNKLKLELQKALKNRLTYVTQDSTNNLLGLRVSLPYIESNIPDSLKSKYPPPPPFPAFNFNDFYSENILCKIGETKKELNNKEVTSDEFHSVLNDKIKTTKGFVAHLYFDEEMNFECYIKTLSSIRNIYYSVRNEYSFDKYKEPNYMNLDSDRLREVQNIFPMRIREINKNEYEKIKKYAL